MKNYQLCQRIRIQYYLAPLALKYLSIPNAVSYVRMLPNMVYGSIKRQFGEEGCRFVYYLISDSSNKLTRGSWTEAEVCPRIIRRN